jgi:hypothetical protein
LLEPTLDLTAVPKMLLVFAHLMLCVFALHRILSTDWKLLRSRIGADELNRAHREVLALLAGLWLTGVVLAGIDLGWDLSNLQHKPKLAAKLVCVVMLTVNGALLRLWCFPRLVSDRPLARPEAMALMTCGAISSTSWVMAAFLGIARPMQSWTLWQCLLVYWLALAAAVPVALLLEGRLRQGRVARAARRSKRKPAAFSTPAIAAAREAAGVLPEVPVIVARESPGALTLQVRQMRGGSAARPHAI